MHFFLNRTKKKFGYIFLGCIETVKSTISQKLKIEKLIFHSFQNIMHHKDHIIKMAFFEGGGLSADRCLGNAQIFLHFFQNFKRKVYIHKKDAECVKTHEKSIFRFLVFVIWSFFVPKTPRS